MLFVDSSVDGHHTPYLNALVEAAGDSCGAILPEKIVSRKPLNQYIYAKNIRSLGGYISWMTYIAQIAEEKDYQIIHFVYGDMLYRFFGLGLNKLSKWKLLVTFHQFRYSGIRDLSLKRIFSRIDLGIVHTQHLLGHTRSLAISNARLITYPVFEALTMPDKNRLMAIRKSLNIEESDKVLLALGGTRLDKGLDILMKALHQVHSPFIVLIAGKAEDFTREEILSMGKPYQSQLRLQLHYLTDDEVNSFVMISDVIVLPYRRVFDGASGPLGLGVLAKKIIVGPNHGSLGEIQSVNHLGFQFETENTDDLASAISRALMWEELPDKKYLQYREALKPSYFIQVNRRLYGALIKKVKSV